MKLMNVTLSLDNQHEVSQKTREMSSRRRAQPIFVSAGLPTKLSSALFNLLQKFKDVFMWSYAKMPWLDPQLVKHRVNIKERAKPVKQAPKNFRPKLEVQNK